MSADATRRPARDRASQRTTDNGRRTGAEAKAPWELDGRKWHTRDRVAGNGRPVRWDGRILESVVDRIEAMGQGGFAPTEWSQRGVVRIKAGDETKVAFPFFHATTTSEWVVTLRFFVPKSTFRSARWRSCWRWCRSTRSSRRCSATCRGCGSTTSARSRRSRSSATACADFETDGFASFLKKAVDAFLGIGKPARFKRASELTG